MFAKKLSGRRWFGRITRAELSCPFCSKVLLLRPEFSYWEPRLSKVTCPGCGKGFYLGMLAWPVSRTRAAVPIDAVPDPKEAKALAEERAAYKNLVAPERLRKRGDPVNIAVTEEGEKENDD